MEIMEEFCVEEFVKKVSIEREYKDDSCEYEVTKAAMEFYFKYPCYENWIPILCGGSIGDYVRNLNSKPKEGNRGNGDYVGAYLLKGDKGEKVLTADILTSIKSPINVWLRKNKMSPIKLKGTGEQIKEYIINNCFSELIGKKECEMMDPSIVPFIKAFAYVYYWCGNMMPVIWNPGVGNRDTIIYKVGLIKEIFVKTEEFSDFGQFKEQIKNRVGRNCKALWSMWIKLYWNEKTIDDFMKSNYLLDVYSKWEDYFMNDKCVDSKWFLVNTKLIAQRSFRIVYNIQEDFSDEQRLLIKNVFRKIFREAQIPEEQWDLEVI